MEDNLLPAELYASNNNGHSNSNMKFSRQGTDIESSQANFLDTEIDMSAENIRVGGHDANQIKALQTQSALQNLADSAR